MAPTTSKEKMKEVSSGNYISDDIAFCILFKLPVKSIKRFSCVRKSWSLLLENPNFFKMFRDNLISKPHPLYDDACLILNQYLYSDDSWNFYFLSGDKFQNRVRFNLPPPFNFNNLQRTIIHILGSSVNGILCICGIDHYGAKNTILWNPEIDQVKVIPSGIVELPPKVRSEIKLHGFGYDHVRSDYKVIRHVDMITFNNNPWDVVKHEPSWEIYSLKSDSWRKTDFDMPARLLAADSDAYLNGICHWCAEANSKSKINLVSFDLSNEVYFITPFPLEGIYDDFGYSVQVLNGFVAVILKLVKDMSFHVSILGELGVKESWVRLFNVDPFPIQHSIQPFLARIPYPIGAWKEGNIFFRKPNYELACLDLTTGVIEEIGIRVEIYCCQTVVYKKNLLPFGVADN